MFTLSHSTFKTGMWPERRDKMPLYNTHCNNCEKDATRKLSYQEYELAKDGTIPCECGGTTKIVFDPSSVSFTLKDGESGG